VWDRPQNQANVASFKDNGRSRNRQVNSRPRSRDGASCGRQTSSSLTASFLKLTCQTHEISWPYHQAPDGLGDQDFDVVLPELDYVGT